MCIPESFEYQDWENYVLKKSFAMGYSNHWNDVFKDFSDVHELQKKLCGKVINPYPENLSSEKKLLEYLNQILEDTDESYDKSPAVRTFRKWDRGSYTFFVPAKLSTVLSAAYKMKCQSFLNYESQMMGEEILALMYKEADFEQPIAAIVTDGEFSHIKRMVQDNDAEANPVKAAQIMKWFKDVNSKAVAIKTIL